ncbi:MAG TPA: hypothetical protein VIQ24_19250 [Pyrinomonadaceae bacterium]
MSNDQSPPVRKVIPYKKGGRRQSPFASNAFQFSGTALDIAIQQREQEEQEEISETSVDESLPEKSFQQSSPSPEVSHVHEVTSAPTEETSVIPDTKRELQSSSPPPLQTKTETVVRRVAPRSASTLMRGKNEVTTSNANSSELGTFITRWKPFLTDTQIKICTYVYNNSTAVAKEFCFTSTARLMAEVSKTERQIKTVLNQLIDWNFLIKGETIVNAPRDKRGTHYRLNLDKS